MYDLIELTARANRKRSDIFPRVTNAKYYKIEKNKHRAYQNRYLDRMKNKIIKQLNTGSLLVSCALRSFLTIPEED
jgi:hypothetical protein